MKSTRIAVILTGLSSMLFAAPATLTQSVTYHAETITLQLTKEPLRGSHFELWSQNAAGGYDIVTPVEERSYIGTVDEYPGAISCGILLDSGQFKGAVYFARGGTWRTLGTNVVGTRGLQYEEFLDFQFPTAPSAGEGQAGTDMYAFDLAMDVDYDYFTQAGSSLATVLEGIEYSVCLVRAFYMRDLLLYPRLGRVVVRATLAHDPYAGLYGGDYLNALKTEWETNHTDADRDVGVGVSPNKVGGGLAWTGTVGASAGYSISQSESNGDFDVVFRHELGHNWGSGHFVGGMPEGYGIMGGNQPGRFTGCEAYVILNFRNAKIAVGGILDNMGSYTNINLPPYASLDTASLSEGLSVIIDVLANDHDGNADTLSINSFDVLSRYGVPVTLSTGTGAGGRDELSYGPATEIGTDYFFYTLVDSSGQTATGVVLVNIEPIPYSILETDADTYIKGSSSYNYGTQSAIAIKRIDDNPDNRYNRTGWIHFDISTLPLTRSSQLRLPIAPSSDPAAGGKLKIWGIVDGSPGDALGTDWAETTIRSYNNPQYIPFAEDANTTLIAEIECGDPNKTMLISTNTLQTFLEADTNGEVTFLLSREVNDKVLELSSRESTTGGATLETLALRNADAYVRSGSNAGSNYGSVKVLDLKNLGSGDSYTRESFLRFVYSNVTEPITTATLKLTLENKDFSSGNLRIRLVADAEDFWDEDSMIWNTKPEGSGAEISIPLVNFKTDEEYSIDVTSLLNQAMNANKMATFHLDINTSTHVSFHSREAGALKPKLDLRTADTDGDGMLDDWENAHALNPLVNDAAVDTDLDGFSNWYEYVGDTGPKDKNSKQGFLIGSGAGGTNVVLRFGTSSNRLYCVEYRSNLLSDDWHELNSSFPGTGTEMDIPDSLITTQRYYRLQIAIP